MTSLQINRHSPTLPPRNTWPLEWRWAPLFLIISLLLHLLLLRHLDSSVWKITFPETHPAALKVQLISRPRPKSEAIITPQNTRITSIDKSPAVRQINVPGLNANPTAKTQTSIQHAPAKIEPNPQATSTHSPLDLSKILEDTRQVAQEAAEQPDGQSFDRRKLQLNPDNIKAPELKQQEEVESYKTAEGDTRVCRPGLDGKKHCMRAAPEQPFSPINENFFVMEQDAPEKTPGELLGERLQEVINPKKRR